MSEWRKAWIRSALALCSLLLFVGCEEQIIHHLSEAEANRLITHLADASIVARKVRQPDASWAISVEADDQINALRALDAARLLRSTEVTIPERNSVLAGREEQRFWHERALSKEIERTLNTIPAVLESRVHLNLPVLDPLFGQRVGTEEGTASVVLVVEGVGPERDQIAEVVAGASGIPSTRVIVMFGQTPMHEADTHKRLPELKVSDARGAVSEEKGQATVAAQSIHAVQVEERTLFGLHLSRSTLLQIACSLLFVGLSLLLLIRRGLRGGKEFAHETR